MSGYDSRKNIKERWTYRELLEMVYVEDLKDINLYKIQKAAEEKQELEDMLANG